jgi:hypothetical protein
MGLAHLDLSNLAIIILAGMHEWKKEHLSMWPIPHIEVLNGDIKILIMKSYR